MVVTGWYDAEDLYGSFKTYQAIEKQNPSVNNVLVVGPWHHGGWASVDGDKLGSAKFGSKTAAFYRAEIEFPFFEKYLKDEKQPAPAEATVFETGSNAWRTFDAWPPKNGQPQAALPARERPARCRRPDCAKRGVRRIRQRSGQAGAVHREDHAADGDRVHDRRPAVRRPPARRAGLSDAAADGGPASSPARSTWICGSRTTGTDADFIVKLIDVFPDSSEAAKQPGYQMLRPQRSLPRPLPQQLREARSRSTPGQPARIKFELLDVLHRFQKGPPPDDPDPEHLVPARRSQPAEVRAQHLLRQARGLSEGDPPRLPLGRASHEHPLRGPPHASALSGQRL